MRGGLEYVGPHEVEEVRHGVLQSEAVHSKRHVLRWGTVKLVQEGRAIL
jgi:hypothetical protein